MKTRDELGDLAGDELMELMPANLKLEAEAANAIVMAARAHWFADEPAPTEAVASEAKE